MKKVYAVLILLLLTLNINVVHAYTKSDIIELTKGFEPCSQRSKSFLSGARSSYTRMLNEREVTPENIDIIYNNIVEVKNYLDSKGLCKMEQKDQLTDEDIEYLKRLYNVTNDILLASPKIGTNVVPEEKVIIDISNETFEFYEDGVVSEVIELKETLNYVGLNRTYIIIFSVLLVLTIIYGVISFLLLRKRKRSKIIISLIYVNIFILGGMFLFRDTISFSMDMIEKMSVDVSGVKKELLTNGKTIVSYPSYGEKYAKIIIGEESEDIYFGDSSRVLSLGLGQSSHYDFVGEGKTVISGHNTGIFKNLYNMKESDTVIIETVYGKFTYEVTSTEIVDHTKVEVLENEADLILYTCYPEVNIYGNERFIVYLKNTESVWVGDNSEE